MARNAIAACGLVLWAASLATGQTRPAATVEQYQQRLAQIDANIAEEHYKLGEWAFQNNLPEVAAKELKAALAIDRSHIKATVLLGQVEARLGPARTQPVRPPTEANASVAGIRPEWLVGADDIARVRLEELKPDEKIPIVLRNDVLNRFIKAWSGREEFKGAKFEDEFRGWAQSNPARVVAFMREKDPENTAVKDDILVKADPRAIVTFRQKIWPVVTNSCAATRCHGGGEPKGGMRLFNVTGRTEAIDYTNYVILDGVTSKGRRLIERGDPESSVLLQFMLPADLAKFHHPVEFAPPVGNRKAPNYILMLEWIRSLHAPPHPDYRLKYQAPFGMKIVGKAEMLPPAGTPPTTKPAPAP